MYELCGSDIVQNVFDGYNGTIMAYGQTGAGKTFTMIGAPGNYKNRGLIPRSISHIFNEINSKPESAITVRVSFVEIYNEEMYDLLSGLPGDREESGSAGKDPVVGAVYSFAVLGAGCWMLELARLGGIHGSCQAPRRSFGRPPPGP